MIVTIDLPDIIVGQTTLVAVDDKQILLCRTAEKLHAIKAICPHQSRSLEGSRLRGDILMCLHHGGRFCIEDGKSVSAVTSNSLSLYQCREEGNKVMIDLG